MNLNQVMTELDNLFTQGRISEVPQFLEEHIKQAQEQGEKDVMLTLYNECIGFYRETGQYDKSLENGDKAMALMEEMGLKGTMPYATTLLNIANAKRASGQLQESLALYNQVRPIYVARLKEDDMYFAGLYNNLSLLYQEMGDFAAAKEQLENALGIVSHKENTAFEIAVTQANLANTCIELGQDDEAKARAEEAIRIFEEIGVDDAHYSAALSALGSLYYMDKDYPNALSVMEKSRECVAKYLGTENIQYQRLSENIAIIKEKMSAGGTQAEPFVQEEATAGEAQVETQVPVQEDAAEEPKEQSQVSVPEVAVEEAQEQPEEQPQVQIEEASIEEPKEQPQVPVSEVQVSAPKAPEEEPKEQVQVPEIQIEEAGEQPQVSAPEAPAEEPKEQAPEDLQISEELPIEETVQEKQENADKNNTPMDEDEIDKILGIDIDNDGWASVIRADKKTQEKEADSVEEEAVQTGNADEPQERETYNPAENVSSFNISSAFAQIKAAASQKLQERPGGKKAPTPYDEEKAVDAMIAEVMDEIAVEVGEASQEDKTEAVQPDEPQPKELQEEVQELSQPEEVQEMQAEEAPSAQEQPQPQQSLQQELQPEEKDEDLASGLTGLELCRRYYKTYGEPMLAEKFLEYVPQIAVGLVGKGSDCFGFDDLQSRDHDFGPRFMLWVTKEVYDKIGSALQAEYEKLPDTFMGVKRIETFHGKDRSGVMVIEDFYKNTLGADLIGVLTGAGKGLTKVKTWLAVHDYALAAAVNGEVFRDDAGIFTSYRELLKGYYPKAVWYRKIAQACALFSQNGQYNLPRMRKRGQLVAAELAKAECAKQAMKLAYLLNRQYAPHDKWLFKALSQNPDMVLEETAKGVAQLVEEISLTSVDEAHEIQLATAIESLAVIFANELERQNMIGSCNLYLDANTAELIAKSDALLAAAMADAPTTTALSLSIAKAEFEAFDKVQNEGGRASCQNNWPTFKVMRMSQYMTWDEDMLLQYLYEFKTNLANGRNMIEEKYARMMASTAPDEYAKFADKLPPISTEKQAIMEQIIALQVKWMEEFAKEYPRLAGNARTIHTAEDLPYDTSYETYLRGELGTYSDKLLEMYGRYVVAYARNQKSITREIMANTIKFYGYKSFEEAERRGL